MVRFGFQVPLEHSRYSIGNRAEYAVVPFHGTFLIDPRTSDLVRLTVLADDIPPSLRACREATTLDYSNQRLNNAELILPRTTDLFVTQMDGSTLENQTVFSGCHESTGESTLRFDSAESAPSGSEKATAAVPASIPADLPFSIELNSPLPAKTVAAGDPVKATLVKPLGNRQSGTLLPKGTLIHGRVIRAEHYYGTSFDSLALAISLESFEANGLRQPFHARLESALERRSSSSVPPEIKSAGEEGDLNAGTLEFEDITNDYVVKAGWRLDGRTTGP